MKTHEFTRLNGFQTRAATLDDLDIVVDLSNAAAIADTGLKSTTREEKLTEWTSPQFNLPIDTELVFASDGQLAGCAQLWDGEPHVRLYFGGRVHPDYRGQGIGSYLVDWAERRARQSLPQAPPETRVSLHTSTPHEVKAARQLFEKQGFEPSRHFFRMLIEMEHGTPPPPATAEGVIVRPFALGEDDRAAHKTIVEAFKDHWGHVEGESFEEWMHWIEMDSTFDAATCFVAETNSAESKEIVGAIMTHPNYEGDSSIAWVDELGVLRRWRKKGIALALLHAVFGEYYRRGKYRVGLGVDGQSLTGALRLYEKAGMHIFQQSDAYQKILRAGQDISTQSVVD